MTPESAAGADDFRRAVDLLRSRAGIVLGQHKRVMVERALVRLAHQARLASAAAFLDHLANDAQASGWPAFINAFTINHTAFFREAHHFQVLAGFARQRPSPLAVWSASCSTGEEAWSIAITLDNEAAGAAPAARVWATDIDSEAISVARTGIYSEERVAPVPPHHLKKYFLRGTGSRAGQVRIKPALHRYLTFDVFNLAASHWPAGMEFDAIFCRNTLIYFDAATQSHILQRFARCLRPGGLLFVGHSENLTRLTDAFRLKGQTVYELSAQAQAPRPPRGL